MQHVVLDVAFNYGTWPASCLSIPKQYRLDKGRGGSQDWSGYGDVDRETCPVGIRTLVAQLVSNHNIDLHIGCYPDCGTWFHINISVVILYAFKFLQVCGTIYVRRLYIHPPCLLCHNSF
jgi:hypothetical protein